MMSKKKKKDYRKLIVFFLKSMKSKARIQRVYEVTKDLWTEEIRENVNEPLNDGTASSRDSP